METLNRNLIYLSMLMILLSAPSGAALAQPPSAAETAVLHSEVTASPMATLTVDTDVDENDGSCSDGDCSLRDAIATAISGDTIVFAGDYTIILGSTLEIDESVTINGSGRTITISGNNAVRVITIKAGTTVTLNELMIANGKNTVPEPISPRGGGILIEEGAVVSLTNSVVRDNMATLQISADEYYGSGGGIYNLGSLTVVSTTFSSNVAANTTGYLTGSGGAIYNRGSLDVTDSTFTGNSAESGSGIYNRSESTLTVENSLFTLNSAPCGGSGIINRGTATVNNSTIANNTVVGDWCEADAAGIGNRGGTMTITNSNIYGNSNVSSSGGGVSSYGFNPNAAHLTMIDCAVYENTAYGNGGGIYNWWDSTVTILNTKIYNNAAGYYGGGIMSGPHENTQLTLINSLVFGNTADYGGGISNGGSGYSEAVLSIANSTVVYNTATSIGGGLYNYDSASVNLDNIILASNTASSDAQIYNQGTKRPAITASNVEGSGGSGAGWDPDLGIDGGGNIDADPRFVDANGADDLIGTGDDDYRLAADSPSIDAGDNAAVPADSYDLDGDANTTEPLPYDLDNTPRFQDTVVPDTGSGTASIVDMGAYEHPTSPPTISSIADQTTEENTPTNAIPFTIGDLETDPSLLVVTAESDNPGLIPQSNIALGGSGENRIVILTPAADQHGSALITITVSDGSVSTSETFTLTVTPLNWLLYLPLMIQ
jgi:CSLREA domain-containing protein